MLRRLIHTGLVALALAAIAGAAYGAIGRGDGAEPFTASFDATAVADPTVTSCTDVLPAVQKTEGRFGGTMTVNGEEFGIHFVLEALVDRSAGLGSAEGRWLLTDVRSSEIVGSGELIAVVKAADSPELGLQGLLIGVVEPRDPDLPAQRLLGSFTASLDEGATFPHLKGTVGDPTVGDPTGRASNPAVLLPAVKC